MYKIQKRAWECDPIGDLVNKKKEKNDKDTDDKTMRERERVWKHDILKWHDMCAVGGSFPLLWSSCCRVLYIERNVNPKYQLWSCHPELIIIPRN